MKLRVLLVVSSLAALSTVASCGGKSSRSTTGNTGGGGGGGGGGAVPAHWREVMTEGATFRLDDQLSADDPAAPTVVTARVAKVTVEGDATTAELAWSTAEGELTGTLPSHIKVSPAGVWFSFGGGFEAAPTYPPTTPGSEEADTTGNYVSAQADGSVCYGEGPGPDAGECEDVCFAELCVAPGRGIVGGAGTWWPNYVVFKPAE